MIRLRQRSIRATVTLWYTAALTAALIAYAAIVYLSLQRVLWAELDDRLHHEIENAEGLLQPFWSADGFRAQAGASPLHDDDYRWLQIWSVDGRLLFESDVARSQSLPHLPPAGPDRAATFLRGPDVQSGADGSGGAGASGGSGASGASGEPFRVKDEAGHIAGHPVVVRVATSERRVRDALADMLRRMLITLPLCAAAAAYGGHWLLRWTLSPIDRLVRATMQVTADNLAQRLPIESPDDEVGQIARASNATLARLDASFTQMRRFTANASHELRTPLTAIRSTGQIALTEADGVAEHRDAIASMLEEVDHLSRLLDTLLLARSDSGQIELTRQRVDLLDLVREIVSECRVLADEKEQTIIVDGRAAVVSCDPTVLRVAVANVVHNAIRYSPLRGRVRIHVRPDIHTRTRTDVHADVHTNTHAGTLTHTRTHAHAEADTDAAADIVVIEVEDDGPGISPEHLEHVFERFYRVDAGRASSAGGVGLGLAMARWAVSAHRGTIAVRNNSTHGSTFTITLPTGATGAHAAES